MSHNTNSGTITNSERDLDLSYRWLDNRKRKLPTVTITEIDVTNVYSDSHLADVNDVKMGRATQTLIELRRESDVCQSERVSSGIQKLRTVAYNI